MIKLIRPDKPSELTNEKEQALIDKFKKKGISVWREDYIVDALFKMSHGKCCYCETCLGVQSRPMHVEHFHYKEKYVEEVISWTNLLPACSQCNSNKGTHDTLTDGAILNPTVDDPRDFFYLKQCMIKSKDNQLDSKGRLTIDLLDLNNMKRLTIPRLNIAESMNVKLENVHRLMINYASRKDAKQYNRTKIIRGIYEILEMAQPTSEYSAFMATIVLTDDDYIETRHLMIEKGLWTSDLQVLHDEAGKIKLDTNR